VCAFVFARAGVRGCVWAGQGLEGLGRRGSALSLVRRLSRMSVALRASCHPMRCSRGSYNFSPWRRRDGVLTPFGSAPVFWNKRARRAADPFCELGFTRWLRCARATRRATRSLHRQRSTLPFIVTGARPPARAAVCGVATCCTMLRRRQSSDAESGEPARRGPPATALPSDGGRGVAAAARVAELRGDGSQVDLFSEGGILSLARQAADRFQAGSVRRGA
jgi:hypothetical protein